MIDRKQTYRVSFRDVERINKVTAIKLLRRLTGLGLKEAKDAVEESMGRNNPEDFGRRSCELLPAATDSTLIDLLDEDVSARGPGRITPGSLREIGATVTLMNQKSSEFEAGAIDRLREALADACNSQNDGLTMDILLVIQKYAS